MTRIDWLIVAFTLVMATIGWRQGFVAGAFALAGFVAGAFLGSRLGPALLPDGSSSPYAPLVSLVAAVTGGSILAGLLETAGFLVRRSVPIPGVKALDGLLGAVLSVAIALGLSWIAGAVALQTPGARQLRADIQRSEILSRLNDVLPPSGPVLNALARFDPFPHIDGPEADVPAPTARVAREPGVRSAAGSIVRVLGTACGLGVEGSGWVAGDGLVVTNAHVVAGEQDTVVQRVGTGPRLDAVAVAFDPTNDVAVLRVTGLGGAHELSLAADPPVGAAAAILGFPQNGPYRVRAGRLGQTRAVVSQDAYGAGPVTRQMTTFRGTVQPGNSGGPLVDTQGRVLTTVFAKATGTSRRGGYGVPNAIVRRTLAGAAPSGSKVSTGPCAG
ncbi:MAG TPA: MarP family serine protease [Baekduia sp.]|uniref:MarP family serine protease n=1 Tax=Baekduia sp. TaxID=2600305 RepID=UPI002C3A2DA6|nr:MarP family serine protease [Baekduia sp.]HMJ35247.1 MarP family serine protease [Baekduia sp.]